MDFLGSRTRGEFLPALGVSPEFVTTEYPQPSQEYFEWIDLLESVIAAKGSYTMMEIGAGWGPWSVRAARAMELTQKLPVQLTAVEAEPRHFTWLQQHYIDNGVSGEFINAAVAGKPGDVLFYVGNPDGVHDKPDEWYGQAIAKSYEVVEQGGCGFHEGSEVFRFKSGWKTIRVKAILLADILRNRARVDLIDMDIQGEELNVIAAAIDELDRRVVRLHVATHDAAIEDGLRALLSAHGWRSNVDYRCLSTNETPFGPVAFVDGIQSWINPKL